MPHCDVDAIPIDDRTLGDDWTFHATTPDDTTDWTDLVAVLTDTDGRILATSQGDTPTLILTGVDEPDAHLDVPPSDLAAGVVHAVVRAATSAAMLPGTVYLQLSARAVTLAGRRTFGTFTFRARRDRAVEVAS